MIGKKIQKFGKSYSVTTTDMRRIFTGIPVHGNMLNSIRQLRKKQDADERIRWMPDEKLHITVFFAGNVEERFLGKCIDHLSKLYSVSKPLDLIFEKFSFEPDERKPRMIWARFEMSESFNSLAKETEAVFAFTLGTTRSRATSYGIPHITLARMKNFKDTSSISLPTEMKENIFPVTECCLYESHLHSDGARYEVLDRFLLNPA